MNYSLVSPRGYSAVFLNNVYRRYLQKIMLLISGACIVAMFYFTAAHKTVADTVAPVVTAAPAVPNNKSPFSVNGTAGAQTTASVSTIVTDALVFKAMLNSTQLAALQLTYTTTLARKWSNLPCGNSCRNGVQIGALTGTTYQAGMQVIRDALSATTENGYDEYYQTCLAEAYLHANGGGNGYDSTLRWMAFLNTPSATGAWMLQFGGHHYAANIAFNNGHVIGATPFFMGTEPKVFTYNGRACSPLNSEHDAFANMLASLTTTQLASAKITQSFMDCYMIPGESSGGSYSFPATKAGLQCNSLTAAQKTLLLALFQNYTGDMDSATAANTQQVYANEIDNSYIAFVGSGTSGTASSFLSVQGNYARVDGPHIWLEFSCQGGIVIQGQIHYHTVWRDHAHDYGVDLTGAAIDEGIITPLKLISFTAATQNKIPVLHWVTANEVNVSHFEIERSADAATGFEKMGSVDAKNLNGESSYSFTASTPLTASVTYFRLKMIDKDGKFTYSSIISIRNTTRSGMTIFPNPANDQLNIILSESANGATVRIINTTGKIVSSYTNRSGTQIELNISQLPAGMYYVRIEQNGNILSDKFIKQGK